MKDKELRKLIGSRAKQRRLELNLTQPYVAEKTDKRKTLLFLTEKAHALKGEYDSVSDEMGSIYYKGFSEEEITRFEECLDRIRKNLEEWQKS